MLEQPAVPCTHQRCRSGSAIDANGAKQCVDPDDIRSKTKVVNCILSGPEDLPSCNLDGSSTGQAPGDDSEVVIKPVAI